MSQAIGELKTSWTIKEHTTNGDELTAFLGPTYRGNKGALKDKASITKTINDALKILGKGHLAHLIEPILPPKPKLGSVSYTIALSPHDLLHDLHEQRAGFLHRVTHHTLKP